MRDESSHGQPSHRAPNSNSRSREFDESQLLSVMKEYLEYVEHEAAPDRQAFIDRHPELTGELGDYLDAIDALQGIAPSRASLSDGPADKGSLSKANDIPQELGDFRIVREIGRGGMGIVYQATQLSLKRSVALKVLPFACLLDDRRVQRFHNEASAVATLQHPNIVPIIGVGCERGVHYYAMQLIDGQSMAELIWELNHTDPTPQARPKGNGNGSPSSAKSTSGDSPRKDAKDRSSSLSSQRAGQRSEFYRSVARLGKQACDALEYAHQSGIIHRDIKPSNLLVDQHLKLWVTDFGLATIVGDETATATGGLPGTVRYMSPEQAAGDRRRLDHRTDIYSLGATIYELATGRPLFASNDHQHLLREVINVEPRRPRQIDPRMPRDLETILLKAMSRDMNERYASAQEVADDLRRFLDGRPVKAKPPAVFQVVNKWTRRNPAITWASFVTLLVVAVAFGVITLLVAKQRDQAVIASAELHEAIRDKEDQLRAATIMRLAAASRAVQRERPIQSVLLAVEAVKLSQQSDASAWPTAHESLLNATQTLRRGRTLSGHGTKISDLTMSSEWLVTLGEHKAHLWDLTARSPWSSSRVLGEDGDEINSMALSDDGHRLVTGGSKLQQWDLQAHNPDLSPLELVTSDSPIIVLSLSPNGRWLLSQSEDGIARFWDLNAKNPGASRILSRQTDLNWGVVSPDGRWVVAVDRERPNTAQLWDMHAEGVSARIFLEGHNDGIIYFAISPNSRWLATTSKDKTIRLWDLRAEAPAAASRIISAGNRVATKHLVFSPDSRWLFADTGFESRILRWDMSVVNPGASTTVLPHRDCRTSIGVSRDGRRLISSSRDGNVRLWDLETIEPLTKSLTIRAHDSVRAAALHPEARWIATAGNDGTARLWALQGPNPTSSPFILRVSDDDIFSETAISSSGRWIATAANASAVHLWDLEARDASIYHRVLRGPEALIRSVEISQDDTWLVTSSMDGTAQLWDLKSEDIQSSLKVLEGRGFEPESSMSEPEIVDNDGKAIVGPHSRWLALSCADHTVRLWDLTANDTVAPAHVLSGHKSQVKSMAISSNGRWLITAAPNNDDSNLCLWDLHADNPQASLRKLLLPDTDIYSVAIDANSRWLATPGPSHRASLLDLHDDDPVRSLRLLPSPRDLWGNSGSTPIWRLAISPDAHWLFTSRFDGTAQLWDLFKKSPTPYVLRGHNGVQSAAISPDSHWLVVGCRSQAYLWDLTARDPTSTVRVLRGHEEAIWSVRISADSRWLVTDSSDGTIRRWCLDTQWLLNHAREVAGRELTRDERTHYNIPVVGWRNTSDPIGRD